MMKMLLVMEAQLSTMDHIMDDTGVCYVEFGWSGYKVYGTREIQFAVVAAQDENYVPLILPMILVDGNNRRI